MGTAKRERQKAGRQARIEQAKVAAARKRRTRFAVWGVVLVGVIILALFALAPDDDGEDVASGSTTSSSVEGSPSTVQVTIPPAGETITGETPCPAADGSSARTTTFAAPPPMCIDAAKTYTAEVLTTEGVFSIELDPVAAPQTVNNFVVLSRYHFYDGVAFHRIIPGFMVQAGDAVGPDPGFGDPGYSIPDELPTTAPQYPIGSLAMANSGPNTSGSQWFITVEDPSRLDAQPNYSRFGSVVSGMEVVLQISNYGDPATDGTPTQEVVIESITITET
jgi:cyclophilin family peptidyl-prolyl cis-trans isomerase